jgi:hypothetical protein
MRRGWISGVLSWIDKGNVPSIPTSPPGGGRGRQRGLLRRWGARLRCEIKVLENEGVFIGEEEGVGL